MFATTKVLVYFYPSNGNMRYCTVVLEWVGVPTRGTIQWSDSELWNGREKSFHKRSQQTIGVYHTATTKSTMTPQRGSSLSKVRKCMFFLAGIVVYGVARNLLSSCDTSAQLPAPSPSFDLAFRHSLGFFDDIPNKEWVEYIQRPTLNARQYRDDTDRDQGSKKAYKWIFFNWDPYFSCPHVRKIGGLGGGPKWTCDVERLQRVVARRRQQQNKKQRRGEHCLVYSIGSNGNYRWEDGLIAELGDVCEMHVFDPGNYDRPENLARNIHYHPWGLGSSYSSVWQASQPHNFYSFQEIRRKLGHENRTIDLFKIDCEGCEFHSYLDWIGADLRQIMIETHDLPVLGEEKPTAFGTLPRMSVSNFFETFRRNHFVLFAKEVNTHGGLGRSSEWSFLKLHPDFFTT